MGKSGGSWFAAIKRAFMSPAQKRICGSRYDIGPEEHKGRGRKRFQKQTISVTATASDSAPDDAFAAAMATAAAAQAAVASAKAALEALPLAYQPSTYLRDHRAATTIQAVFRGYLARRALNALKGLVKLQALVRGQNVRRQAEMTLRSVQAMVRLQGQMRDQRTSHLFMNDINIRRASTEHTVRRNDAALHCDSSHVSTFLQQDKLWSQDGEWMTRKQRSSPSRSSFDQRDMIKTIEIDTYRLYSVSKDIQHAMLGSPRGSVPHYMSATESTKARIRSQSAPRQRAMTPERDRTRGTKKRLSSPIPDPSIYKTSLGHFLEHEELGWANNAYPTKPML